MLELTNVSAALQALDEDEKGVSTVYTLGGDQQVRTINESGLYSLRLCVALRLGVAGYAR